MQDFVVTTLMKARDIPNVDVTLNVLPGNHALVTSSEHRHIRYIVHIPAEEWQGVIVFGHNEGIYVSMS